MLTDFPAVSAQAILLGFEKIGLDIQKIRAQCALADKYSEQDLLPLIKWTQLWAAAAAQDPRPELATLVGLNVPFGAFGIVDYLVGSSANLGGAVRSLADHFSAIASRFVLEVVFDDDGNCTVSVIDQPGFQSTEYDEFTIGAFVGHFREITTGKFIPLKVSLACPAVTGDLRPSLLQCSVVFDAAQASVVVGKADLNLELNSSDPKLHQTLSELAEKLGLKNKTSDASTLEVAVRSRLRHLLPQGKVVAAEVAQNLGLSERTLHRKLADQMTSYQRILDLFRMSESERLLLAQEDFSQVALKLGFSDQSSWSRAFKKMKGVSPKVWLEGQRRA